jgi:TonB family protein
MNHEALSFLAPESLYPARPPRWGLRSALAAHALLFAAMLYAARPAFVRPSVVLAGKGGDNIVYSTALISPTAQNAAEEPMPAEQPHIRFHTKPGHPPKNQKTLARTPQYNPIYQPAPATQSPPAGSPFGSLSYGEATGSEVRPAIRVAGSEPQVFPWDLANVPEGNIIVEVTIDDRGNITQKVVLQSLSPRVDNKVLAALEDWHFLPATRDGVAIPSKQDVYYHYPVRR